MKSKYQTRNKMDMFLMYWRERVVKGHEEPSWASYHDYCSGANIMAQAGRLTFYAYVVAKLDRPFNGRTNNGGDVVRMRLAMKDHEEKLGIKNPS